MPPAFNLSQDQTLQFNSCLFNVIPDVIPVSQNRSLTQKLTGHFNQRLRVNLSFLLYFFREHFNVLSIPASLSYPSKSVALPSSAHTYRLLIFKEPVLARTSHRAILQHQQPAHPTKRFVCQQQRDEIMPLLPYRVNCFVSSTTGNFALNALLKRSIFASPTTSSPTVWCSTFAPELPRSCDGSRTIASPLRSWQALCENFVTKLRCVFLTAQFAAQRPS